MKKVIIASIFALALVLGSASTASAAYTFANYLRVGSTGADVTALQSWLVSQSFLTMPAGVSMGYFGQLTKAAVVKYQASVGLPATGFVGPLTVAKLNGTAVATAPAAGCPAGYTCTALPGTTVPAAPTTGITTPGVEGTLTASASSAGLSSTAYEGDTMVAILGAKLEAKNSDIAIQRVKIDLGASTLVYNKVFRKLYVTDGTNVLASVDLNSSTVVKDSSRYYITVSGFTYIVPKGSSKQIVIKADLYGSIDSSDRTSQSSSAIRFAADGIRGIDGAGIDQYSPVLATDISRTTTISAELAETATLKISTNSSTPKAADVIADGGSSDDELDKLTVLTFDLKAEKDNVVVTDLTVDVTKAGSGGATASTTVYLYDGSTELDSASYSSGSATFSDIDIPVSKDSTKTLTVKVDIRNANGTVSQIAADIDTADVTAENSKGDSITESGSATGETQYVRDAGIRAVLVGTPSISKSVNENNNISTTTSSVTFNVQLTAVGDAIVFGTQSASSTFGIVTYDNDASSVLSVASSTSFTQPTGGDVVTTGLAAGQSFRLNEGGNVTIPVTFTFINRIGSSGALLDVSHNYKAALDSIVWATNTAVTSAQTTNFMSAKSEWRSGSAF